MKGFVPSNLIFLSSNFFIDNQIREKIYMFSDLFPSFYFSLFSLFFLFYSIYLYNNCHCSHKKIIIVTGILNYYKILFCIYSHYLCMAFQPYLQRNFESEKRTLI